MNFGLEDHMPTFAYEYQTAVDEGYLADYHCIENFLRSQHRVFIMMIYQQKIRCVSKRYSKGEEVPDYISGDSINSQYFNIDTNRRC